MAIDLGVIVDITEKLKCKLRLDGMNEKEAVKHVCNEINKMILSRQNNDVHTVSKVYDTDKYCTEKNMIEFIEGFSV